MFGLTGARVQSQSEQIWMYNRYEIVMEYAKRPRLPPPFVVISYIGKMILKKKNFFFYRNFILIIIGMLISSCSRQCVLKLKEYSDKKESNTPPRPRTQLLSSNVDTHHDNDNSKNNPTANTPLVSTINNNDRQNQSSDASTDIIEDHSFLGRFLNCKPCRQVTENQQHRNVCF
jgi:hypothetical protein